jgi:putative porin
MKANKTFVTALALAALTAGAWAQTETASSVTPSETPVPKASSPDTDLRNEVDQLLQLVREQQKRIDALEAKHSVPANANAAVPPAEKPELTASATVPAQASPQSQTPAAPQNVQAGSSDERIRNLERQIKGIGPISFSGDVRLRGEPFFGGPADQSLDRMRERVRVRFNALADLGSQFQAGITLASGDINDPTTTNQTMTGFYTRKTIALDQAFVQFKPREFKPLTLIGGKFRYPWYNTEMTWDKDLNPEGAAETFAFSFNNPVFKRLALVAFQLPFAEVAATYSNNKRIGQQITYGGQVQTTWQLAPHVSLSAYSAVYDFEGADVVALALAKANSKNPQTPLTGALPLASGNPVQDSTYTTTATTVITVNGTTYPTGVSAVSNAQFGSQFRLFDNIARLDIDTGHPKMPVMFLGDYVQNMGACDNLAHIAPAPANTSTTTYKQAVNAPCVSKQRRGYWAEGRVGRLQKKGDFQFGYTHLYIEREAVLGNFNYSDIRQGTNVTQHRIDAFYQMDKSVQLGFTALVGRPLATTEPWLTRLQFDSVYVF